MTKETQTIRRFKGLNCWDTASSVGPEWALDLRNVLVSGSGGLEKLRVPSDLSDRNSELIGSGNIINFQNALGKRQLLAMFDQKFYTHELDAYEATLRDTSALNEGVMSVVVSNNIAFIANGHRMMKWDGTEYKSWGISKPAAPQPNIIDDDGVPDPIDEPAVITNLASGTLGARTYSISYTWVDVNGNETAESPANTKVLTDPPGLANMIVPVVLRPDVVPDTAVGWNCYCDIAGGTDRRRMNTIEHGGVPMPASVVQFIERHQVDFSANTETPLAPTVSSSGTGRLLATGRKYRVAYGSQSGHMGPASEASESTGEVTAAKNIQIVIPNPSVDESDRIFLFATVDGGEDYYLCSNKNSDDGSYSLDEGFATTIIDSVLDDDLNKAIVAPLINLPPPTAKYISEWGGRIYGFCLDGAPQDIFFTGYERIYVGRPEESVPPNNRIKLAIGSDEIRGGGVIQAGIVAFSKSNEMFMLRGTVTDRSTDAPVQYLAELEKLPFKIGCASHHSIVSTPYGLVWLASDLTIKIFNGVGSPVTLGGGMLPILRSITRGTEEDARGLFFSYLEREWYLLLCAANGSTRKNLIIIVDLEQDPERSVGGFVLEISADAMEIVEDANGTSKLVILQDGIFKELKLVSDTRSGISIEYSSTESNLEAHWRSGYFGNESPEWWKMFRYGTLVADQMGFGVQVHLVDDQAHTFRNPEILPTRQTRGKFTINRKSVRASIEIQFPNQDTAANVLSLSVSGIPTSQR
jgi:hypothetical protein